MFPIDCKNGALFERETEFDCMGLNFVVQLALGFRAFGSLQSPEYTQTAGLSQTAELSNMTIISPHYQT